GAGTRRVSIFDRIAEVVLKEEQEQKQEPVDAKAIRLEINLQDEFYVTFREGAMGMTLSMDESKNAKVGKVVPQGQAYRA
ncbi:unnamed protein product, partial [Choristocarpus tenellus]